MNRQHAHELPGPTIAVLYKQIKCISGSRWSAGTMTDLESPKNGKHLEQVHHNKWVPPQANLLLSNWFRITQEPKKCYTNAWNAKK